MTTLPAPIAAFTAPAYVEDVAPLFGAFVNELDASPVTARTYAREISQFGVWLARRGITAPVRADIIAYRDELKARHKPGTARCYMVAVKMFFRWAVREGFYPNVAEDVRGVRVDTSPKRDALTSRQAHTVLEAARADTTEAGLRNYALLGLLLSCGLRCIEAARANVGDLRQMGEHTVLYVQGKGHSEADAFVRVPGQVEDAIRAYFVARGRLSADAPLFASTARRNPGGRLTTRSLSGIVKSAFLAVGLDSDRLTAHSCRHSACSIALDRGRDIYKVSQYLRHQNISTTQIYAHNLERLNNDCSDTVADAIF